LQLDTLFTIGALLDDRDGDGLPDGLRTRIVLGSRAQRPEHLAAVDLAARLGFASLPLELPLVCSDHDALPAGIIPLFVGRRRGGMRYELRHHGVVEERQTAQESRAQGRGVERGRALGLSGECGLSSHRITLHPAPAGARRPAGGHWADEACALRLGVLWRRVEIAPGLGPLLCVLGAQEQRADSTARRRVTVGSTVWPMTHAPFLAARS
jgi:hypothetical protein